MNNRYTKGLRKIKTRWKRSVGKRKEAVDWIDSASVFQCGQQSLKNNISHERF